MRKTYQCPLMGVYEIELAGMLATSTTTSEDGASGPARSPAVFYDDDVETE